MFLSIAIAIYNAADKLDMCIDSIIQQTFKDYELILVDDGSKDNSIEICEKWAKQYPEKIRLIKKENTGSLLTRRVCLKESLGEYIYLMDADDALIDLNALDYIYSVIKKYSCDLLFFNCTTDLEKKNPYFYFPFQDEEVFENDNLEKLYKYYITQNGLKPLWNKVFSRNVVDWDANYDEYINITNGTDFFQSTPIISNTRRALFCDKVFYYYRVKDNTQSIVHTFKPTIFYSAKENYIRLECATKYWKLNDLDIDKLLKKACMKMISTSVYKARLISKDSVITRNDYIKQIGEDNVFRKNYSLFETEGLARKIIVLFLYHRQYKLLDHVLGSISF